jgi:flagellar hook protein FlgE
MFSVTMSGLAVAQKELAVTSNNLANASTTGFKRSDTSFADVFASDSATVSRTAVGLGAKADSVFRYDAQGSMTTTQRVTDLAVSGRGYFIVKPTATDNTSSGSLLYTRAGSFGINADGYVVNSSGAQLQSFAVDKSGTVATTLSPTIIPQRKSIPNVTVQIPTSGPNRAYAGDTVALFSDGAQIATVTLTATDIAAGTVNVTGTNLTNDNKSTLTATVTGAAGKTSPAGATVLQDQTVRVGLVAASGTPPTPGTVVNLYDGATLVGSKTLTAADIAANYVDLTSSSLDNSSATTLTATLAAPLSIAAPTITAVQPPVVRALFPTTLDMPAVGDTITIYDGQTAVGSKVVDQNDITNRYANIQSPALTNASSGSLTAVVGGKSVAYPASIQSSAVASLTLDTTAPNPPRAGDIVTIYNGSTLVGSTALTADQIASGSVEIPAGMPGTTDPTKLTASISSNRATVTPADSAALLQRPAQVKVSVAATDGFTPVPGDIITLFSGGKPVGTATITATDISAGYLTTPVNLLGQVAANAVSAQITSTGTTSKPASGVSLATPILQSISIENDGRIGITYSDDTTVTAGYVAIANFPSESGLDPVGDTNFAVTLDSGAPIITRAGPPAAGRVLSSTLEQANVDMTQELTNMIRAQQVYNANARMLQTQADTISRITDKL